jgi:hypothetical protein
MNLIPNKDKVRLDAWTAKSMLSFVKMKTHKDLGSHVAQLPVLKHVEQSWGMKQQPVFVSMPLSFFHPRLGMHLLMFVLRNLRG